MNPYLSALALGVIPLKSAAWGGIYIPGGVAPPTAADADLMPLDNNNNWNTNNSPPGAGVWPLNTNLTVRKVALAHLGDFPQGYAVVGHSGPNGDHVTPFLDGPGSLHIDYPADAPIVVTAGEFFDVHAGAQSGHYHAVLLTLWYTVP